MEEATGDDFVAVLKEIRDQVAALQSELDLQDAADVQEELDKVEQLAQRDQPPARRIFSKLHEIGDIVQSEAGAVARVDLLLPLLQRAAAMAQ